MALHLYLKTERIPEQDPGLSQQKNHVSEPPEASSKCSEAATVLLIDLDQQVITYRGLRVELSSYPFKLLAALARTPGRVVNKAALYDVLYGNADAASEDDRPYERQLADHKRKVLAQLRKAVGNQKRGRVLSEEIDRLISVRRGVGYTLNLNQAEVSILKETAVLR